MAVPEKKDVLVIGGGMVGSLYACQVALQGLKVVIVEKLSSPSLSDQRSFAISFGSMEILKSLGVWDLLASPQPIQTIAVSQDKSSFEMRYGTEEDQNKPLGFMVPHLQLSEAILRRIQDIPTIQRRYNTDIQELSYKDSSVETTLTDGTSYEAPLLIAADGRFSTLRERLNLKKIERSYHQHALICNLSHTRPHQACAFEHFLSSGPLALLPLSGHNSALVWTEAPDQVQSLKTMSEKHFLEALIARIGQRLGSVQLTSPRMTYPLHVTWCPSIIKHRTAFIGDAAHTIHPVAGQGLNLGIRDANTLACLVSQFYHLGLDWGSQTCLKSYQKKRQKDIFLMVSVTHSLIHIFSLKNTVIRWLREWGMRSVCRSLKKQITAYACGESPLHLM